MRDFADGFRSKNRFRLAGPAADSTRAPLVIERVRIPGKEIAIEGAFTLPELARLSLEDQIFVTAFLRSHGSIKEMEQVFGVSYPTIKARLTEFPGFCSLLTRILRHPAPTCSSG